MTESGKFVSCTHSERDAGGRVRGSRGRHAYSED